MATQQTFSEALLAVPTKSDDAIFMFEDYDYTLYSDQGNYAFDMRTLWITKYIPSYIKSSNDKLWAVQGIPQFSWSSNTTLDELWM